MVLINNHTEIEFFKAFGGFIVREDSKQKDDTIIINPMYFRKQINRLQEDNTKLQTLRLQQSSQKVDKLEVKKQKTI